MDDKVKERIARCSCGGSLKEGQALIDELSGIPDFVGDTKVVTVSPTGAAYLEKCLKCDQCGKSWALRKGL